ncbi:MAG: SPOR domain-containing protein [Bacteroidota bacterium]
MPDLNLVDEGGLEETPTPITPSKSGDGGGGGAMRTILIFLIVAVIVGGGGFFLYKKGIFPFKKKPAPVQIEDEPLAAEPEQYPAINPSDTAAVSLLETAPVEDHGAMKKAPEMKPASTSEMMMASSKLSDMKGDYTIQVVAFREKSKADDIVRNLDEAGYPAFVERIPMKDSEWYTVRVGRYPSAKDARKAVESFGEQLKSSYFVDRVRSK